MLYILSGVMFKTKKEIIVYIRNIVSKYKHNEKLNENDSNFIKGIIINHPDYKTKFEHLINCEIDVENNGYGSKHFRIGEKAFSWYNCINYIGVNKEKQMMRYTKTKFNDACRNTIKNQIEEYLNRMVIDIFIEPKYICEITKEIHDRKNVHVDHHFEKIKFKEITDRYLEENKLNYRNVETEEREDFREILKEPHYTQFNNFHREKAILRIIKKEINLVGNLQRVGDMVLPTIVQGTNLKENVV